MSSRLRSVLFAPAVRPDHLAKLGERGADAVVIDCEDATPATAKDEGRAAAKQFGASLAHGGCQVFVRINAVASPWFVDDVNGALSPGLAGVVVPKADTVADLDAVTTALNDTGLAELGIFVGIETVRGVADARSLASHPRVIAAYFGAEDFIADIGGRRTVDNLEVLHARSSVVMAGRLGGVPVVDQVVTDFRNSEAFEIEAAHARDMGYAGKLCIHPGQVALANEAFTPSDHDVDRACRLIAMYERATEAGLAAIDFEGQMVDGPLVAQARRVIDLRVERAADE